MGMKKIGGMAIIALLLTGCAQDPIVESNMRFCELFDEGTSEYVAYVASIGSETKIGSDFEKQMSYVKKLEMNASKDVSDSVEQYASPIDQVIESISATEPMTIDLTGYKKSIPEILEFCSAIGYTASATQ